MGKIRGVRLGSLLLAVMLLVACGRGQSVGQQSEPQQQTQAGSEERTGQNGGTASGELRLGVLTSFTGEFGPYGQSWLNATKMAVEEMRQAGWPLGREVQLYVEDDGTKPEIGIRGAQKLIGGNQVSAIIGPTSSIVLGILDYAKQNQVVVVSHAAGTTKLDELGGDYVYRTVASDSFEGRVAAQFIRDQNIQDAVMMYEINESTTSLAKVFEEDFAAAGGSVKKMIAFNPGQTSYQSEIREAMSENPSIIFLASGIDSGSKIIRGSYQQGYSGKWLLSGDMATSEMFSLVGPGILEGAWVETPGTTEDSPNYKRYADLYRQTYNEDPGPYSAPFYDAVVAVGLAMEASGDGSGPGINRAMREIANPPGVKVTTIAEGLAELRKGNDIDYDGVSGPVDFDDSGTVPASYQIQQARGDRWEQVHVYPADFWE